MIAPPEFLIEASQGWARLFADSKAVSAAVMFAHFAGLLLGGGAAVAAAGAELTYPIPAADGATVDRDNGVIVARHQGRVFAFNLSCPHENAAVRWKAAVGRFECSRHDSRYEPNGTYTSGRATRNMDRFPVRRAGGTVVVDVATLIQSDTQRAQWEAAVILL